MVETAEPESSAFQAVQERLECGDTHLAQVIEELSNLSTTRLRGIAFSDGDSDDTRAIAAHYLLGRENGFQK